MALRRAVFLDKDDSLIENDAGNVARSRTRLARGAVEGLRMLAGAGFEIVIASNQPGVALGHFPLGALAAVEEYLHDLFLANDLELTACYWCPHHPDGKVEDYSFCCTCRKPMPGLLQMAAHELELDLERSWLIGYNVDDVEAGRRAGCSTVLLDGAKDLPRAAGEILRAERRRTHYRLGRAVDPRFAPPASAR